MFILIYGSDGTGKSVQAKSIAEANESAIHWSFATKNRKLYETSPVESIELLSLNEDITANPFKTIDNFQDRITLTIKENKVKLIVIDEITLLRKWAQPVVLEKVNKARKAKGDYPLTKIGRDNFAAWEDVNNLVYGNLERISNWAVINNVIVLAICAITEERMLVTDSDGKSHSETTGRWICDAKPNIKKLADVIVRLEKNGSKGTGYYAFIEKTQNWMNDGSDSVKVGKDGLLNEFLVRGVIE
jgi:hypothetical protein